MNERRYDLNKFLIQLKLLYLDQSINSIEGSFCNNDIITSKIKFNIPPKPNQKAKLIITIATFKQWSCDFIDLIPSIETIEFIGLTSSIYISNTN